MRLPAPLLVLPVLLLVAATGCTSARLHKNVFEGRHLAVTAAFPPEARVRHPLLAGGARYRTGGGTRPYQRQLRRLEARLQDATARLDLPAHVAKDLAATGTAGLGMILVQEPQAADYVLDFRVYDYGLVVDPAVSHARFYLEAEATLRERAGGAVRWRERLSQTGRDRYPLYGDRLETLSAQDLAALFDAFATQTTERMVKALRQDIREK